MSPEQAVVASGSRGSVQGDVYAAVVSLSAVAKVEFEIERDGEDPRAAAREVASMQLGGPFPNGYFDVLELKKVSPA